MTFVSAIHTKVTRSFFRMPMVWAAVPFAAGIICASHIEIPQVYFCVGLAAAIVLVALIRGRRWSVAVLVFSFTVVGGLRLSTESFKHGEGSLKSIYDNGLIVSNEPVMIEGTLQGPPEPGLDGSAILLSAERLTHNDEQMRVSGTVKLFVVIGSEEAGADLDAMQLSRGSRIRVSCRLRREDEFRDPGVIPKRRLLDRRDIDAVASLKSPLLIEPLGRPAYRSPIDLVYSARSEVVADARSIFSPETAGVVSAVLLGEKEFLGRRTADLFRDGGTFHILVISGLHITFLGGIIFLLAGAILKNKRSAALVAGVFIWVFALAVGAEVPVVRAAIMFSAYLVGKLIYRRPNSANSVAFALLVILAWRPLDIFDASFQLTAVSVGALLFGAFPLIERLRAIGSWMPTNETPYPPNVNNFLKRACETLYWNVDRWEHFRQSQTWSARIMKRPFFARFAGAGLFRRTIAIVFEAGIVSFIVQIAMVPLSIYYFHRVSIFSVILNIWVSGAIVIESGLAVIALVLYRIAPFLAMPFAWATAAANSVMLSVPEVLSMIGRLAVRIPVYGGALKAVYLVYFIPLIGLAWVLGRWNIFALGRTAARETKASVCLAAAVFCLATVVILHPYSAPRADGRLHVDQIDVGQGDSALVTFPNGTTMLVDGGGRPEFRRTDEADDDDFEPDIPRIGEAVVSEVLWERGLSRIDILLATHGDADHAQGLVDVIKNFNVGEIYIGPSSNAPSDLDELIKVADERSVSVREIARGTHFEIAGVQLETLWPLPGVSDGESDNNGSLVFRIAFGGRAFLFTGDIERETEAELVSSKTILKADLVKVAHHGSRTSSTEGFIKASHPEYAIISAGRHSIFGHPHQDVVERWKDAGSRVLTTSDNGMISVSTDGRDLRVGTFDKYKER